MATIGNLVVLRGKTYARLRVAGQRIAFVITAEDPERRKAEMVRALERLRAVGQEQLAAGILKQMGIASTPAELKELRTLVDRIASGKERFTVDSKASVQRVGETIQSLGEKWTNGTLAKLYPDHIKAKRRPEDDAGRLKKHVYPVLKGVLVADFTLDHAESVMASLDPALSSASRRHVAQLMSRLLAMAVYPLRLRPASPLPPRWMPRIESAKATAYLYPDDDRKLCGAPADKVPLAWRLLYGCLAREGMRASEAAALTWSSVDLERGAVSLDENKTDDPRSWALDPGVVRALVAWRKMNPKAKLVFVDEEGAALRVDSKAAERFREHLQAAGVDRPELYQRSKARKPIRLHDLRATFVTLSLANGKSETWVSDRTGHKSSAMLARYRRGARKVAELNVGALAPLDAAIPELAARVALRVAPGGSRGGQAPKTLGSPGRARTGTPSREADFKNELAPPEAGPMAVFPENIDSAEPRSLASEGGATRVLPTRYPVESNPVSVEDALAKALEGAALAGRWDVVSQLAKELEARRLEGSNVVGIEARAKVK